MHRSVWLTSLRSSTASADERPRGVVLTPVAVDAVDETLDAVRAEALALMVAGSHAHTDLNCQIAQLVILCGQARVRESTTTPRALGHLALSRPTRECPFRDAVVDSGEVVATHKHVSLILILASRSSTSTVGR